MVKSGLMMLLIGLAFNTASFAAGFDCGKAATPVEKMICSDPQVSELDSLLAKAYKKALSSAPKPELLRTEQRTWLSSRRDACQDVDCLKKAYNDRLAELKTNAKPSDSGSGFPGLATEQPKTPVTDEMVLNGDYDLSLGDTPDVVSFKNGVFNRGAPGDDDFINAKITNKASGDLNGDKIADAAIIITFNTGGSGTFVNLFAVFGEPGKPLISEPVALGDRVVVKSLKISAGKIMINLMTHKASDPACCPSLDRTYTYCVKEDKLVEFK